MTLSYLDPDLLANIGRGNAAAQGGGTAPSGSPGAGGNFLGPLFQGLGSGVGGISEAIGNKEEHLQSLLSGQVQASRSQLALQGTH